MITTGVSRITKSGFRNWPWCLGLTIVELQALYVWFYLPCSLAQRQHNSESTLRQLRGRCSAALWGPRNARDHFLAPLLSASCIYEPFLIILQRRWKLLQRLLRRRAVSVLQTWSSVLAKYHDDPRLLGPCSYLFHQFQQLGWTLQYDAFVVDQYGTHWNILTDDWSSVQTFIWDAWVQRILPKVRDSEQFSGLLLFHLGLTRSALMSGKQYNTLLANYCTGAILSTGAKVHFLEDKDAVCQLCCQPGGPVHLITECPATRSFWQIS